MRGFEIDCRIKHYQGRIQSGRRLNILNNILGDSLCKYY